MKIGSAMSYYLAPKTELKGEGSKDALSLSGDPTGAQPLCAFGLLRDVRVHSQDTLRSVADIKTALAIPAQDAPTKPLTEALAKNRTAFDRNQKKVGDLLARVKVLFEDRSELYSDYGDEVSQIADLWDRINQNWPAETDTAAALAGKLAEIENWLREVIWHCGFITIPPRVNEHLNGLRPGQALDFHKNFLDELPDKKDRDEILKYLQGHPLYIEGITDVEHGFIYRADHNPRVRLESIFWIAALVVAGVPLVWVASHAGDWLSLAGWPVRPEQFQSFLVAYIFVLLGSLLHVVIAAFKQARSGSEQPFTALDDFVLWIHVKELPIMGGILTVWFGLFGLVFMGKLPEWQTALFVGYGIDSVVDVLLQRFEAAAPKRVADL